MDTGFVFGQSNNLPKMNMVMVLNFLANNPLYTRAKVRGVKLSAFPKSEIMKKKWLEIIGSKNIKPRLKSLYVCSMHFNETSFNRTLDVIRLRDGAVPASSLISDRQTSTEISQVVLQEGQKNVESEQLSHTGPIFKLPSTSAMISDLQTSTEISQVLLQERQKNMASEQILLAKNKIIHNLLQKCEKLKKKVKRLNEKVRRRDKKIALLSNILKDLQKRNFLKSEETRILEECAGPEDFLKRQIAKSRGTPVEKKYSEEIIKFAFTLHNFSPKAYTYIRKTYNTCLPHPRTLSKWYQHVDGEPGLTKEAIYIIMI